MGKRRRLNRSGGVHKPIVKKTLLKPQAQAAQVPLDERVQNSAGFPGCNNGIVNFGQGYGGGNPWAPQISQMNTVFENLRWYLISNFRQPLSEAYVELPLVQTVVDIPVDDALRGGIEIQSKQLSPEQIEELQISLDRDDDLNTIGQAAKWTRLFGGAGILIIIDDQDYADPLDLKSIRPDSNIEFRAVDMWELFWTKQNTDGYDPEMQTEDFEFYNYYSHQVHKSRVMRMKGLTAPSFIRPRLRGWGFSVIEILLRSLNQYLKATDVTFACLDEFKVDIFKLKNFASTLMMPDGGQKVINRVQWANQQKNYQNALIVDKEDEWDHKEMSFAGIAETLQGIRMQVASDMRMPITKLFGTSASGGIGNTDQNDLENYNAMVESQVRNKIKYDVLRILEIKCQKIFGFIPDDLQIDFKPLRILSALDEENVKNSKFTRLVQAVQMGKISDKDFIDSCNKENLLGVQLENTENLLNPTLTESGEAVKEGLQNPKAPKSTDDPGANREDRRTLHAWESQRINQARAPVSESQAPDLHVPLEDSTQLDSYQSAYDYMAYQSEGGDDWITLQQMNAFREPIDPQLWEVAAEASLVYLKSKNEKYQIWVYRKWGGLFKSPTYQAEFDLMTYEFEGGNDWIRQDQLHYYKNPSDESLWKKSLDASMYYLSTDNYKYRLWFYRKNGGAFL